MKDALQLLVLTEILPVPLEELGGNRSVSSLAFVARCSLLDHLHESTWHGIGGSAASYD